MTTTNDRVLRIFEVTARPGCGAVLVDKFATTSAAVVNGEPGNLGWFFGGGADGDEDRVVFISIWEDLAAVKARFGEAWRESLLPEGYADLIESCSVRHVAVGGWKILDE